MSFYIPFQIETAEVAAEASAAVSKELSAIDILFKGGVILIPIFLLLFYTIYLMVERYRYITRVSKYNANTLHEIQSSLNAGDMDRALQAASRDNSAYSEVLKEGILTIGRPVSEIENNMEKVTNIEINKMEKNLGYLGLIAGIAPTFGFIGTILGVIKIFYNISESEDVSIGNISGGLYEKMISSGSGLAVGLIAFAAYHILNALIDRFVLNAQKVNLDFVNIIQRPSNGNKTK